MSAQERHEFEQKSLLELLQKLDERVTRVERTLGGANAPAVASVQPSAAVMPAGETGRSGLELKIGEFGLAWFGSLILLLGIAFLMTYTHNLGYRFLAACLGFGAAAGFYIGSRAWHENNSYLSKLMASASMITFFYAAARLHYFVADPLLEDGTLALAALLAVVAVAMYLALKRGSESAAVLALVLGAVASLLSRNSHTGLALLVLVALVACGLVVRRAWWAVAAVTSLIVYSGHMLWLCNNPVWGGGIRFIAADQYSLVYLFLTATAFFLAALVRKPSSEEDSLTLVALNCAGFSLVLFMAVFALYRPAVGSALLTAAGFLLACSIIQWLKTRKQWAPAIYACSGYLALSVGVSAYAQPPNLFLWLALQSLVVVSMALWFRSKVLVVANSVIFLGILLTYVTGFDSSNWVNFSFALVAHGSARIMNWKKERLTLRTEMLRNIYMVIGFVFVLYGLAHAVPAHYVTLSWIGAATTYFLISIALGNHKYRWLAVTSVLVTIAYLLVVDLPQLEAKYRVPAFLVVGIITLVISLYYTRFRQLGGAKQ